jgi:N-acetyl-gamma-glutamyl-phosphate reductase
LPLIPLLKKGLIKKDNIIIDSKSGYSGAGRGILKKYKDKNLHESLSAYGIGFHRHNPEIEQMINKNSKGSCKFDFTPHLSPMFRGILSTIYVDLKKTSSQLKLIKALLNYYNKSEFIKVLTKDKLISTNDVINTNYCHISICKTKNKNRIIILSAIDNLIKGGAGQAIQNMNLRFGFPIHLGLK